MYGLLRIITSYFIGLFMAILHDLLRVVTDNYNEQLTGILQAFYALLRVYYGKLRFIEAFTC